MGILYILNEILKKQYVQSIIEKNFNGLIIQRHARRSYPQENIGGQLVGFTNVDDKGIAGIEKIHENYLSGKNGWVIKERSGLGKVNLKNNYPKQDPVDGLDVQLTYKY